MVMFLLGYLLFPDFAAYFFSAEALPADDAYAREFF